MKIYKTIVQSDNGSQLLIETLEYEGDLWLVCGWLESLEIKAKRPARIILMDKLAYTETPGFEHDYALNIPIPKSVLSGQIPPEQAHGFVVLDKPDILIR